MSCAPTGKNLRVQTPVRAPNDLRQYDDLQEQWWRRDGDFAALHWLAAARAELIPPPSSADALLVDIGCGGGLLTQFVDGYRHVGVDRTASALRQARAHGAEPLLADATGIPLPDDCAEVVVAGEILEHVDDLEAAVAEAARVLAPGGVIVFDTINDTLFARLTLVRIAERLPGGPPPRIHDPALFVDDGRLTALLQRHGIDEIRLRGLRPSATDYARFLADRSRSVRMLPTRLRAGVYQGMGRKR
jgi:2-polyprenyl-6-hydroxyphenyl methylase/3-demethylubiquinone-9 3-methyltransferase